MAPRKSPPDTATPKSPTILQGWKGEHQREQLTHSWHCSSSDPAHLNPQRDRPGLSRTHHQECSGSTSCHLGW